MGCCGCVSSVGSALGPRTTDTGDHRPPLGAQTSMRQTEKPREVGEGCEDLRGPLTHHLHIGDETEAQRGRVTSPGSHSHPEPEPGLGLGQASQPRAPCPSTGSVMMKPTPRAAQCRAQAVLNALRVLTQRSHQPTRQVLLTRFTRRAGSRHLSDCLRQHSRRGQGQHPALLFFLC